MNFVCLQVARWPTGGAPSDAAGKLLAIAPHVIVDAQGAIWLDARGLDAADIAQCALDMTRSSGIATVRAAAASTAVVAAVAAHHGSTPVTVVPPGTDASFLAPLALTVLKPSPRLLAALTSVGIETCGALASLTQEAVEVRLGIDGVALWRLARADDPRRIFRPMSRALPSASLVWEEYALRDPEQLLFTMNRLVTTICTELATWGEAARALTFDLRLADGTGLERSIRVSRATANRGTWMRVIRREFERLQLPDGVAGLSVRVDAAGVPGTHQGDVFDRGFQTARAIDEALAQLHNDGDAVVVVPAISAHPLPEHRLQWKIRDLDDAATASAIRTPLPAVLADGARLGSPRLVLQLFPEPRRVSVVTTGSDDHPTPTRFRTPDGQDMELSTVLGPDHVSGGMEGRTLYARAYFTCVTSAGLLVLLFRDALADVWYYQGWWD